MAATVLLAAGGCFDALNTTPFPMVTLSARPSEVPRYEQSIDAQLIVSMPECENSLNTDRIALLFENRDIKYLSNAKWESPAPRFIQQRILMYVKASNRFSGIGTPTSGIITPYRLNSEIRRLHMDYGHGNQTPTAVVSLDVTLLNSQSGRVIADRIFSFEQKANSDSFADIIEALDTAVHQVMVEISGWTAKVLSEYHAENGTAAPAGRR